MSTAGRLAHLPATDRRDYFAQAAADELRSLATLLLQEPVKLSDMDAVAKYRSRIGVELAALEQALLACEDKTQAVREAARLHLVTA